MQGENKNHWVKVRCAECLAKEKELIALESEIERLKNEYPLEHLQNIKLALATDLNDPRFERLQHGMLDLADTIIHTVAAFKNDLESLKQDLIAENDQE